MSTAVDMQITWSSKDHEQAEITYRGKVLDIDTTGLTDLRILIDGEIAEYYGNGGLVYGALELREV